MELWIFWFVIMFLLLILEIFTPGFLISIFSIGALGALILSFFIKNIYVQILIFSIINLSAYIWLRPVLLKLIFKNQEDVKTNTDLLIGKKGKVIEKIDNVNGTGRVKVGPDDWKAISIDDNLIINEDEIVEIIKVDGAKLIVKK